MDKVGGLSANSGDYKQMPTYSSEKDLSGEESYPGDTPMRQKPFAAEGGGHLADQQDSEKVLGRQLQNARKKASAPT